MHDWDVSVRTRSPRVAEPCPSTCPTASAAPPDSRVRRAKARFPSGRQTHPARVAPAGSNCSDEGGDEIVEAYDGKGHLSDSASLQAATIERRVASKGGMRKPTHLRFGEGCHRWGRERYEHPVIPPGWWRQHASIGRPMQHGKPQRWWDVPPTVDPEGSGRVVRVAGGPLYR